MKRQTAKKIGNFVLSAFASFVVLVVLFYLFFNFQGEAIVEKKLAAAFHRPVVVEYLRVLPPFGLMCDNLEIGGLLAAKEIRLQLGFPDLSGRKINIASLTIKEPHLRIQRTADNKIIFGEPMGDAPAPAPESTESNDTSAAQTDGREDRPQIFSIEHFSVKDGEVMFWDLSGEGKFNLTVQDIKLKAEDITYPLEPVNAKVDLSAFILGENVPFSGSNVEARGWINWPERNMDGTLIIKEPNGKVSLSADLKSKANDMAVKGTLQVKNLARAMGGDPEKADSLEGLVFDALSTSGMEIGAEFDFKTKMDDFHLGAVSFKGKVGYQGDASSGGTEKDFKDIGQQFEDFGKQFYKDNIEKAPEAPSVPEAPAVPSGNAVQ